MIEYKTLLSLPFLEKSRFTGSDRGMRYSIYKVEETAVTEKDGEKSEEKISRLEAAACPGPFSVDHTKEELFVRARFSFDDEGRKAAVDWLNHLYEEKKDFFEDVYLHPDRYYQCHHREEGNSGS